MSEITSEDVRKLILRQFGFLNTLLVQIDCDYEKIMNYDQYGDPLQPPDDIDYDRLYQNFINSLYQRSRIIVEQFRQLSDMMKELDIPDGKLRLHLSIAIKHATKTIEKLDQHRHEID